MHSLNGALGFSKVADTVVWGLRQAVLVGEQTKGGHGISVAPFRVDASELSLSGVNELFWGVHESRAALCAAEVVPLAFVELSRPLLWIHDGHAAARFRTPVTDDLFIERFTAYQALRHLDVLLCVS